MASEGWMAATIRIRPKQRGHSSRPSVESRKPGLAGARVPVAVSTS